MRPADFDPFPAAEAEDELRERRLQLMRFLREQHARRVEAQARALAHAQSSRLRLANIVLDFLELAYLITLGSVLMFNSVQIVLTIYKS